jgi:hypothetical protein
LVHKFNEALNENPGEHLSPRQVIPCWSPRNGQIDDQIRQYTGADAYGRETVAAVALAKE